MLPTKPTHSAVMRHPDGTRIAFVGVVALSPDVLLIRLIDADLWAIVFWRSLLTGLAMLAAVTVIARIRNQDVRVGFAELGWAGILMVVLGAGGNLLFTVSITHTHAANTLAILSATPLVAAGLGTVFLEDRVPRATWAASLVAVVAIGVVLSGSIETKAQLGDLAALAAVTLLAASLTVARRHRGRSMLPTLVGSSFLGALVAAVPSHMVFIADRSGAWALAVDALLVVPVGLSLMIVASRYIPAPNVALIYLLEAVLGPLWVWLAIGEVPPRATILGGAVLLATLSVHAWHQRAPAAGAAPSHDI